MKMRHFWRWPLLCSMLLGLASAGSAAAIPSSIATDNGESHARNGASRLAHDARLHARVQAIRTAMREARTARHRPAVLRTLADRVEQAAGHMVEDARATPSTEAVVHVLLADLYSGADALRSSSKSARTIGLARIDGALHEYGLRFDPPSTVMTDPGLSQG